MAARALRVGSPEIHSVTANDGVALRLSRYRGGDRGPVMLVHCIGVSSAMYSLDTVPTNLLEFLFEAGFDVWLRSRWSASPSATARRSTRAG